MKPIHIVLIVLASIGVASVVSLYGNSTQYVSFPDADRYRTENPNKEFHVVCRLDKSRPIVYDAEQDANHLEFTAIDSLGNPKLVVYNQPKPQDMERSEKLVLVGKSQGKYFHASQILSKCPSKYEDAPIKQ